MRRRRRRAPVVVLVAGVCAGVWHGGRVGPGSAGAHDCERVELLYPTTTLVHGTSGCTTHNTGSHICVGDATTEVAVVVCRE